MLFEYGIGALRTPAESQSPPTPEKIDALSEPRGPVDLRPGPGMSLNRHCTLMTSEAIWIVCEMTVTAASLDTAAYTCASTVMLSTTKLGSEMAHVVLLNKLSF
ncbi:hypothetical protein TNCV_4263021 [Trichonephila clavipes]|nr:hypothetical protein TNCV_4263021 [Trichonephila clavipes]